MYNDVALFIDGVWGPAASGRSIPVVNPATGEPIGSVAHADRSDLDRALEAADKGFAQWRKVSAFDRSKLMRKTADILRSHADAIAGLLTLEQGKPLPEARGEVLAGADVIDWFAEEARRAYGRHRSGRQGDARREGGAAGGRPDLPAGAGRAEQPGLLRGHDGRRGRVSGLLHLGRGGCGAGPNLEEVDLPSDLAVAAQYGETVINGANPGAQSLEDYLLSPTAQAVLASDGFGPPTSVPEPTSAALLGVGLLGLVATVWRRQLLLRARGSRMPDELAFT